MGFFTNGPLEYPTNQGRPVRQYKRDRAPTSSDFRNFTIGDEWLDTSADIWYKMSDKTATFGIWIQMGGTPLTNLELLPDSGTTPVVPNASDQITVTGANGISTVGGVNTLTITASGGNIPTDFLPDSGTTPVEANGSGEVTVAGGTNIDTVGSLNTLTWNLTGAWANIHPDSGTDPVVGDASNEVTVIGSGGVTTTGGANALTIGFSGGGNVPLDFIVDGGVSPVTANAMNELTITGAGGISTNGSANTITIQGTDGIGWIEVTGTTQSMDVDTGYIANNAAQVDFTLPSSATLGDRVRIVGKGAGGWTISQNAGQTIHFLTSSTTTGVGGSITPTEDLAAIELLCTTATTDWTVLTSVGNFTVV